jgi:hypothetical protein
LWSYVKVFAGTFSRHIAQGNIQGIAGKRGLSRKTDLWSTALIKTLQHSDWVDWKVKLLAGGKTNSISLVRNKTKEIEKQETFNK